MLTSRKISCPCCGEPTEIVLDLSVPEQQYIEDCYVCCRPIVISYRACDGAVVELSATAESE